VGKAVYNVDVDVLVKVAVAGLVAQIIPSMN
jgi:hypothetical protein